MNENIAKIEAKGFQDLCNYFKGLEEKNKFLENENTQLKANNKVLGNELTYFKEYSADLEEKINDLQTENTHFKAKNLALTKRLQNITLWDLSSEAQIEAGHALARDLLGKPMTPADIAEEEFISQGEQHYADTWNINCGDDF